MNIEEEIEKVEKDIKNADVNKDYGEGILHTLKRWQADRQRLEDKWAGMTENKHIKELRRELAESKHKLKQMTDNAFTGSASCKICFEKHKKEIERLEAEKNGRLEKVKEAYKMGYEQGKKEKPALMAEDVEKER